MVLTQLPTAEPANDKPFSFSVYSGVTNQVSNLVYDGSFNFQGGNAFNINSSSLWLTQSGSNTYNFTKTQAADITGGQAYSFNGVNSYVQLQASPNFNNSLDYTGNVAISAGAVIRFSALRIYRSVWNTTAMECLVYGRTWYVMINQTPGYLSYYQQGNAGFIEVKIPLSSLSAGWHNILWGYDSSNLYLNVDNGAQQSVTAAGNSVISYLTNKAAYSYLGCFADAANGSETQKFFFTGIIKDFSSWCAIGTITPALNIYTLAATYNNGEAYGVQTNLSGSAVLYGGIDYHFTFDNDTSSQCFDLVQGVQGNCKNITLLTGSANTSGWYNSRALFVPLNNPGATAVGFKGNSSNSKMLMNFSQYQYFLGMAIYGGNLGGTGVVTIQITDGTHTWSTNLSIAQLNTNSWQNFNWGFIPSQFGLSSNAYISIQVTGSCTGTLYFDHLIVSPGAATPYFDLVYQDSTIRSPYYNSTSNMYLATQYTYAYIKNWSDVGSLPINGQEVTTLGATITLQLNRDPNNCGEGNDLKLNNRVLIQYASPNSLTGATYFDGYIADYTLDYTKNNVQVILASWGQQAANYLLLAGTAPAVQNVFSDQIVSQLSFGSNASDGYVLAVKTSPTQTLISGLNLYFQTSQSGQTDTLFMGIFASLSDATGSTGNYIAGGNNQSRALAFVQLNHTYAYSMEQIQFLLNTPLNVSPGTTYYIYIFSKLQYSGGGIGLLASQPQLDTNSSLYAVTGGNANNTNSLITTATLQYDLLGGNNSATVLYTSKDPSAILQSVVNNLRAQGVNLNYTNTSIDTVGQNATYQFITATGADAFNTIPTLCPPGWYIYIDMSSNTVHLHSYSSRPIHKLLLGSQIKSLTFEKRMDTMVNTVYFTGGSDTTNPGFNIFRVYQNSGSVALYGVRMKVVSDNRVTTAATADIVAQSYLNVNPEIKTIIEITDKSVNLESFNLGDLVNFGNFLNGKTTNWDQVNYDNSANNYKTGYWDFDITSPETLYLYIERIDASIDSSKLTLSTTPPEVNKKLQATLNQLLKQQTLNNPAVPTQGTNIIT